MRIPPCRRTLPPEQGPQTLYNYIRFILENENLPDISEYFATIHVFPGHWEKPVMWNSYLPHGVKSIPVSRHCTRCCQIAGYAIHPIEKKTKQEHVSSGSRISHRKSNCCQNCTKMKKEIGPGGGGCVPGAALGCAIAWCWFSTFISLTSSLKYIIIMWSSLDLLTQRNRRFCPRLEQ